MGSVSVLGANPNRIKLIMAFGEQSISDWNYLGTINTNGRVASRGEEDEYPSCLLILTDIYRLVDTKCVRIAMVIEIQKFDEAEK